jgi:hypothetical protein
MTPDHRKRIAQTIFWAGWISAIAPVGFWWFADIQADLLRTIFPGWNTWMVKGTFVGWVIWSTTIAAAIAATAMTVLSGDADLAPSPVRYWAVMAIYAGTQIPIVLAAFGGEVEYMRHWSAGAAALPIAVWIADLAVVVGIVITARPATPLRASLAADESK